MRSGALLGLLFLVLGLVAFTVTASYGATFRNVNEGAKAPSFKVKTPDGSELVIEPADGNLKAVFFLKLSQESSRNLVRDAKKFCEEVADKEVRCIYIFSYSDAPEDVARFVEEVGLKGIVGIDADGDAYEKYGLFVFPATALIKEDGTLAFEYSSYDLTYADVVGGELKVLAGVMTEEEYQKLVKPPEGVEKTDAQKEADRLVKLGKRLASRGLYDRAAEKFKEAVEKDPTNAYAKTLYGESLARSGKAEEAVKIFDEVLRDNPLDKEAKLGKGIALIFKGDYDGAIEILTGVASLNPRPERAYYWLGVAHEKKGEFEKAVKYYRKALKRFVGEK